MKKIITTIFLLLIPFTVFAENPREFVAERNVTVNTTGATFQINQTGYLRIFAHAKVYYNLDPAGVTPNTSSKWLAAGGEEDTNMIYYRNDKIGLKADSGTVTVNFTSDLPKYNR